MFSQNLINYQSSLSYAPSAKASVIIREAMNGNIPELVAEGSFDADGDADDVGDVHTVYNCHTDRFDAHAALSADEYRTMMAKVQEQTSIPAQKNESQPAADSAE